MTKYIFIIILISLSISQEIPGEPTISWMPTEYDLIDESINLTLSWNMWWGENGDHWKLYENSNNIYQATLISDSPNSQNDEANITLFSAGDYQYIVQLCNEVDENEICSESNPVIITINNNGSNNDDEDDSGNSDLYFDKNIIGYYTSWSIYARDYEVADIPVNKVNVINYAFANINPR